MSADVFVHTLTTVPGGDPVQGVRVSLHQTIGTFISAQTTDATGSVFLGNLAEGSYEIRITPNPPGYVVSSSRQTITVQGTEDQTFDIAIDTSSLPAATDDKFCRCTGYFVDPYGKPYSDLSIHLSPVNTPTLFAYSGTTKAVVPESLLVKTDHVGVASVDLIRGHEYSVYMEGYENIQRLILVPDLLASSLPDVLFPTVDRVEYDSNGVTLLPVSAPTLSVSAGAESKLGLTTVFRSGLRVDGLVAGHTLTSSDGTVFTALASGSEVTVTGVSQGSAKLEITVSESAGRGTTIKPAGTVRGDLLVSVT